MDSDNNEKVTRRRLVEGVADAAVRSDCSSSDCRADSKENSELEIEKVKDGEGKEHLAAACGTYCGACPSYLNKYRKDEKRSSSGPVKDNIDGFVDYMDRLLCDGCLSGGKLTGHCQNCDIRLCAANKENDSRCSNCEELPCHRVTNLINHGNFPHRQEYLPNLKKIREMGVQKWIQYEEERWRCPRCGLSMSWYDAKCTGCGEPRSERVFPLPK
jgi:hypothetical protein